MIGRTRPVDPRALVPVRGEVAFATSGHTGRPQRWLRGAGQLRREARLLAGLAGAAGASAAGPCDGVVSFAPVEHLYGFVAGPCLAAELGVGLWLLSPVHERALPRLPLRRPVVVALPSSLGVLERQPGWLAAFARVTVLHSTARLPEAGRRLAGAQAGEGSAGGAALRLVELFGSTETGLVAWRRHPAGEHAPWTLAADVTAGTVGRARAGVLRVSSPRLARAPGRPRPRWRVLADAVELTPDRRGFRLLGRVARLLKVNGRRVDLDAVEARLRPLLGCSDLACVPFSDDLRGESYDLLLVDDPRRPLDAVEARRRVRAALGGEGPRRVRLVGALPRSATGKLLAGVRGAAS